MAIEEEERCIEEEKGIMDIKKKISLI